MGVNIQAVKYIEDVSDYGSYGSLGVQYNKKIYKGTEVDKYLPIADLNFMENMLVTLHLLVY